MNGILTVFSDGGAAGAGSAEWHMERPNERDLDSFLVGGAAGAGSAECHLERTKVRVLDSFLGWRRGGRGIGRMAHGAAK
jgi:hypothetical protein